jgi:hypothetical protein
MKKRKKETIVRRCLEGYRKLYIDPEFTPFNFAALAALPALHIAVQASSEV